MQCPRLNHFVRFNPNGTVSRCGHMVNAPEFNTLDEMDSSEWMKETINAEWATECIRCKQTEAINETSIRLNAIAFHNKQIRDDYLIVGGVLDNVCNSACLTCNEQLSTKIGSLMGRTFPIVNNSDRFWNLPTERIAHLDINGGEPSASKNYRHLLQNIPPSVKSIRINTNCSMVIPEIEELLSKGIHVTVTVSLDGIGDVHDYVRYPIKWDKFYHNLMVYKTMGIQDLNTWTTVSALNINDFPNILKFVKEHNLNHSYALLNTPSELNVGFANHLTIPAKNIIPGYVAVGDSNQDELDKFLEHQNRLRNNNDKV